MFNLSPRVLAAAFSMGLSLVAGAVEEGTVPSVAPAARAPAQPTPASVPGPVEGTRITEAYVRMVARDLYFWAWPMVNVYNRRLAFEPLKEPGWVGGVFPAAPPNQIAMLTDYIEPSQRDVACPNQDVVYGGGPLALDIEPVVVQVPDFGSRFWVYQIVDLRTDSFAGMGSMYESQPGFYLLVGPDWKGEIPSGMTKVFRSTTNTGFIIPRVYMEDTEADNKAVQSLINRIVVYPLSKFDGKAKVRDWSKTPSFPAPPARPGGGEAPKVIPEKFWDTLPLVLKDAPALPGEALRYAQASALLAVLQKDPKLKAAAIDEANKAEKDLIGPLLQFRNYGIPLPHNWTTIKNGAEFGTDYFTRTAVARSNIFVNKPNEATYFYQDLDSSGVRLNGNRRYTVKFGKGQPPVNGFWSLTLYDGQHFFAPNKIKRYSIGTKNKDLTPNADGSVTIYVQASQPSDPAQRANWLPAPGGKDFSLYIRTYWPKPEVTDGTWTPPAVIALAPPPPPPPPPAAPIEDRALPGDERL
ncbi:DUF1254 domain-containing protein [Pseudomonas akapageensis]|uniref:DUF1254 domain-containing protein n=1 Tax=Pseudomonas akapageensis TaxID=2609961 RepID=UPI001FE7A90E|nr:DUF1254 domain-containing protein [Pseudomonas akapageensis]